MTRGLSAETLDELVRLAGKLRDDERGEDTSGHDSGYVRLPDPAQMAAETEAEPSLPLVRLTGSESTPVVVRPATTRARAKRPKSARQPREERAQRQGSARASVAPRTRAGQRATSVVVALGLIGALGLALPRASFPPAQAGTRKVAAATVMPATTMDETGATLTHDVATVDPIPAQSGKARARRTAPNRAAERPTPADAPALAEATNAEEAPPVEAPASVEEAPAPPIAEAEPNLQDAIKIAAGETRGAATDAPVLEPAASSRDRVVRPSHGAVSVALGASMPSARRCLAAGHAEVTAGLTFGASGAAERVSVTPGGTTEAACIEQALLATRVSPFTQASFTVRFTVRP